MRFACLLLAAALLAQAGVSRAEADQGLDTGFLQSWLHMDASDAAKLQTEGAAAVAARRGLMQESADAGTFGAAALPGAYDNVWTTTFTATIPNMSKAKWTAKDNSDFIWRVKNQATTKAGGSGAVSVVIVSVTDIAGGKLNVRATVNFPKAVVPGNKGAAQYMKYIITTNPGSSCPWLSQRFAGATCQAATTVAGGCTAQYCITCPTSPSRCGKCVPSVTQGGVTTPVYRNTAGVCQKCMAKYCAACKADGKCNRCKGGYKGPVGGVCLCAVPNAQLCAACNSSPKKCDRCVRSSGATTVYKATDGTCKKCTVPGCQTCTAKGNCGKCKGGFVPNGAGGCRLA